MLSYHMFLNLTGLWAIIFNLTQISCKDLKISSFQDTSSHQNFLNFNNKYNLKNEIKDSGYRESFIRANDIFNALSKKTKKISFFEKRDVISMKDISNFPEFAQQSLYSIAVDYNLVHDISSFVSMDNDMRSKSISFIDDTVIHNCHNDDTSRYNLGNILIASDNLYLSKKQSPVLHQYLMSEKIKINKSFKIIRKIKSINVEGKCVRYETETLHPFELIESFILKTNISHPFRTNYYPSNKEYSSNLDPESQIRSGKNIQSINPSSPMKACTDDFWGGSIASSTFDKGGYKIGFLSGACAEYADSFPGSFNYNYNFNSKSATQQNIPITKGVICKNCYLFFGAFFSVHIEYNLKKKRLGMEVILNGGAGAKAEIKLQNPLISKYEEYPLITNTNIDYTKLLLGTTGVALNFKFDYLKVGISGTGKATGTASIAGSYTSEASLRATYFTGRKEFKASYSGESKIPEYKSSKFKFSTFGIQADLIFGSLIKIDFLSSMIFAKFKTESKVFVSYQYKSSRFYASVQIGGSKRKLIYSHPYANVLKHGQILKISLIYNNFTSNENITLFYSLVSKNMIDIPILMKDFKTSVSGSGVFKADWLVPWDKSLIENKINQSNYKIQVRCSNMIDRKLFSDSSVELDLYSDYDSVFLAPRNNQVLKNTEKYKLQWMKTLLKYFDTEDIANGVGKVKICQNVRLYIISEVLNPVSFLSNTSEKISLLGNNSNSLKNVGYFQLTFPSNIIEKGDRFYFQVECVENENVFGWSGGYFYFQSKINKDGELRVANITNNIQKRNTTNIQRLLTHLNYNRSLFSTSTINSNHYYRVLSSTQCPSNKPALLGFGLEVSFTLSSIGFGVPRTFFSKPYELYSSKKDIELGSSQLIFPKMHCAEGPYTKPSAVLSSFKHTKGNAASNYSFIESNDINRVSTSVIYSDYYYFYGNTSSPAVVSTTRPTLVLTNKQCNAADLSYIGDGWCDLEYYNTAECNYDGGDCCNQTCTEDRTHSCGSNGFLCLDPIISPRCAASISSFIGDGWCDNQQDYYNSIECNFDGGDCCTETCGKTNTTYSCGSNGYECKNPSYPLVENIEPTLKPTRDFTKMPFSESLCKAVNLEWIGDGWCDVDLEYNTDSCGYDGGDCCQLSCQSTDLNDCGSNGYNCIDPNYKSSCAVIHTDYLGDGYCDNYDYNSNECNYDNGDCCLQTCQDGDYMCGQNGYNCRDPLYSDKGDVIHLYYCDINSDCIFDCSNEIQTYNDLYDNCVKMNTTCFQGYCLSSQSTDNTTMISSDNSTIHPSFDPSGVPILSIPSSINPTLFFSISPTLVPYYNRTIESTLRPIIVTPTVSPTFFPKDSLILFPPSISPSIIPATKNPTLHLFFSPSVVPTYSPSYLSTYDPSYVSTTTTRPILSSNSSQRIVTESPINSPTLQPPQIVFVSTTTVQGLIDGCLSMNNNTTRKSFIISQSIVLNISRTSIQYLGCTVARRLLNNDNKNNKNIESASYNIATEIVVSIKRKDFRNSTSDPTISAKVLYNQLVNLLTASINSGSFVKTLQDVLLLNGAKQNSGITVSSIVSSGLEITVFTYKPTNLPSNQPLLLPSSKPNTEVSSFPSTLNLQSNMLSVGAIIGIAGGVIVLICIILIVAILLCRRRLKNVPVSAEFNEIESG